MNASCTAYSWLKKRNHHYFLLLERKYDREKKIKSYHRHKMIVVARPTAKLQPHGTWFSFSNGPVFSLVSEMRPLVRYLVPIRFLYGYVLYDTYCISYCTKYYIEQPVRLSLQSKATLYQGGHIGLRSEPKE